MFFIISKVFEFIANPLFWVFLLLLIVAWRYRHATHNRILWITIGIFFFFANAYLADQLMRWWEPKSTVNPNKHYSYVVVLGGMGGYSSNTNIFVFRQAADRLLQALPYLCSGQADKLIISGGNSHLVNKKGSESDALKHWLHSINISDSLIISESRSRNTYENALYVKHYLDSVHCSGSVLLVSSGMHMPRAIACFKAQNIIADYLCTDPYFNNYPPYPDKLLIPDDFAIRTWAAWLHEVIGIFTYKLSGYI